MPETVAEKKPFHILGPKFLRIRTPRTTDGITLAYDEDKQIIYKEQIAPLSAKKYFERENSQLQIHLRHEIIVMDLDKAPDPASIVKGAGVARLSADQQRIADLEAQLAALKAQPVPQATVTEPELTPQQKANATKAAKKAAEGELV